VVRAEPNPFELREPVGSYCPWLDPGPRNGQIGVADVVHMRITFDGETHSMVKKQLCPQILHVSVFGLFSCVRPEQLAICSDPESCIVVLLQVGL